MKSADALAALLSQEFRTVSNRLANTSAGNLLDLKILGGPTICCAWVRISFSFNVKFHGDSLPCFTRTLMLFYKVGIWPPSAVY